MGSRWPEKNGRKCEGGYEPVTSSRVILGRRVCGAIGDNEAGISRRSGAAAPFGRARELAVGSGLPGWLDAAVPKSDLRYGNVRTARRYKLPAAHRAPGTQLCGIESQVQIGDILVS